MCFCQIETKQGLITPLFKGDPITVPSFSFDTSFGMAIFEINNIFSLEAGLGNRRIVEKQKLLKSRHDKFQKIVKKLMANDSVQK